MNTNILNSNIKELYLTKVSKEDAVRKAILHIIDNPSISSGLIEDVDWDSLDVTFIPTYSYRISWKAHWSADIGHNYTVQTNGANNRTETRWTSSVGAESGNETYTLIANRDRFISMADFGVAKEAAGVQIDILSFLLLIHLYMNLIDLGLLLFLIFLLYMY